MQHTLIIGGSGMLADVSIWFAREGHRVSVIGRDVAKLRRLEMQSDNITSLVTDYTDYNDFRMKIKEAIDTFGPFQLVIAWIHSNHKDVIGLVSDENKSDHPFCWDVYHILGSGADLNKVGREINVEMNCSYHQIQLGFVIEQNGRSRWLTHKEISSGVIRSVSEELDRYVVGCLEPWEKRP